MVEEEIVSFVYKDLERIFKERKYRYFYEYLPEFEKRYLDDLFA
jgi:hypothetical protein